MSKQFNESLNTAVLTSKYVMHHGSPIVYVAHHDDGIWEFWGTEIIEEAEIMVVSLAQILQIDPSVLDVADMSTEFNAIRSKKGSPWSIVPKN